MKFVIIRKYMYLIILSWLVVVVAMVAANDRIKIGPIAKQGCNNVSTCGNITIPFPFGMGNNNCYLDDRYILNCTNTNGRPRLMWQKYGLEVFDINLDGNNMLVDNPAQSISFNQSFIALRRDFSDIPVDISGSIYLPWYISTDIVQGLNLTMNLTRWSPFHRCYHYFNQDNSVIGIQCSCTEPYVGNPYIPRPGCQDFCSLNPHHTKCNSQKIKRKMIIIGICTGIGALLLFIASFWLYKLMKKRYETKQKEKLFQQNGGLLLQQKLMSSSSSTHGDKAKLFESRELEKATDHFHDDRIIGEGGQGTVYKGMLTDGTIVAVKKSKDFDISNVEQFINEVVILSQINHRNVVKLIGCCLETKFPLLVYEFISNGTLYHHIHTPTEDFRLSWGVRLRIACEIAGALSYLHSSASMPIYHRDIKSSNILMDDKYKAKVADFGTSKSISIDQTHLTTVVQGTFGYLDPEYFQSSQLTDKSDVYSFGVVILELLTSQKPILSTSFNRKSLATYFIESIDEGRLIEILDRQTLKEGCINEMVAVAQLARRCLNLNGRMRPTMKEVSFELEGIEMSQKIDKTKQNQPEMQFTELDLEDSRDETSIFTGSTCVDSTF